MSPRDLKTADFQAWPPLARDVAVRHIDLIRGLPLCFVSLLFREMIAYDWKFPAERDEIDRQLAYLATPRPVLARFAELRVTAELERMDWVNAPAKFSERLTAHLWASRQMDAFRAAAVAYYDGFSAAIPEKAPAARRVGVVILGQGVRDNAYPLFRKLRRQGTYFRNVRSEDGVRSLVTALERRAAAHPVAYGHWLIEGGSLEGAVPRKVTPVSYAALEPMRASLAGKIREGYRSRISPEVLQSELAAMTPADLGMRGGDPVWDRFALSLFTEGSGTQVFSTTFVQWAAREAIRRARPVTVLTRYAPRLREQPADRLLSANRAGLDVDPQGALVDADMGAWYTWLSLRRLPQSQPPAFLAWFENHSEAVAIGPGFAAGAESAARRDLSELAAGLL